MPKIVDHEERRSDFIAASLDLIAAEGVEAVTLRRVAADAGFTTGAVAHYFASRRDLLIDTLRGAHNGAGARMLVAASQTQSPKERLLAVVRESLPLDDVRRREWRVWIAFWAAAAGDAVLSDENHKRYREWRSLLQRLCRGALSPDTDEEMFVLQLLAAIDGLGLQIAVHGDRKPHQLQKMMKSAEAVVEALIAKA